MSRSKQHDRNRRVSRTIGRHTNRGRQEHPEAPITRAYQVWKKDPKNAEVHLAARLTHYEYFKQRVYNILENDTQ